MTTSGHDTATHTHDAHTYLNPVYRRDFPDPYVLKFANEYWAYCTGIRADGHCFGVLHSRDLVTWTELRAGALAPLPGDHPCYWAPEVVYHNGRFLMYYSVGNEKLMHLRVATSSHPAGPFVDSDHRLTREEFAIDAHVFVDVDGARHLFYATDFLTHTHVGTGTVRDRMLDDFTLAGDPRPVTRARYDWQVYDPHRIEKGGVRWHTVEGPFVLRHKALYYEMFSGGNWQNLSYGVSYAVSETIETEGEWRQVADGQRVLPILRTIPGAVTGPGHNSVVRGPDNRQLYCVYHRWADEGRVLAIDRQDYAGERMIVLGPTNAPQPAPLAPWFADHFDEERTNGLSTEWECSLGAGHWVVRDGEARQESAAGVAEARCLTRARAFVAEVTLRAAGEDGTGGVESGTNGQRGVGLSLLAGGATVWQVKLLSGSSQAVVCWQAGGQWREFAPLMLPASFQTQDFHLLRLEVNHDAVCVALDEVAWRWSGVLDTTPDQVALLTENARGIFKGFALTRGWQDLFEEAGDPARLGWHSSTGQTAWRIEAGQLSCGGDADAAPHEIAKGEWLEHYELVVNARLAREATEGGAYGFRPADDEAGNGSLFTVERRAGGGWSLAVHDGLMGGDDQPAQYVWPLPETFDPTVFQQFRFRKQGDQLNVQWESDLLGELAVTRAPTRPALYARAAVVAFDMVRVTAIK